MLKSFASNTTFDCADTYSAGSRGDCEREETVPDGHPHHDCRDGPPARHLRLLHGVLPRLLSPTLLSDGQSLLAPKEPRPDLLGNTFGGTVPDYSVSPIARRHRKPAEGDRKLTDMVPIEEPIARPSFPRGCLASSARPVSLSCLWCLCLSRHPLT